MATLCRNDMYAASPKPNEQVHDLQLRDPFQKFVPEKHREFLANLAAHRASIRSQPYPSMLSRTGTGAMSIHQARSLDCGLPEGRVLKYGKADQARLRQKLHLAPRPGVKQEVTPVTELASCACVEDWLRPECDDYRGMRVPRRLTWGDVQHHVDTLASSGIFGRDECLQQYVDLPRMRSEQALAAEFAHRSHCIVARLRGSCLPDALLQQIQKDFQQVGIVVAQMFPTAERVVMKLEIQGHSVCERWHQDSYVGRAIVSYNGAEGTVHVHNDNVDFVELVHCGNNEHIIRDKSQVFSVDAGDVLFIKGKHFPNAVNGLVHKAPLKRYHADGTIKNRLTMKVDVSFLQN